MGTSKRPAVSGGRDDCWSDGATAALIDAWGERHLRCNRGNLRHNDWSEVSAAVNRRRTAAGKPPRTDIQCKNRIDTLKKKYKVEKAKPLPSTWLFFDRLHYLISPNPNPKPHPHPNPKPRNSSPKETSQSSMCDGDEEEDDVEEELMRVVGRGRKQRLGSGGGGGVRELAKAMSSFGEIYERMEGSKMELVMELERQRMEFLKELECQRMNMIVDAQLAFERLKRPKNDPATTGKENIS